MLTGIENTTAVVMASKGIKMGLKQPNILQVAKSDFPSQSGEKPNAFSKTER